MKVKISILFLMLLGQLPGTNLHAQPRRVQTYTVADGLAQSQVYALLADSRGYIWAGTQGGGLSRFDGRSFRTYADVDGLAGNNVQALWENADGELYIGTNRGLSIYDGEAFRNELNGRAILAVTGDHRTIWVLTENLIYHRTVGADKWQQLALPHDYMLAYSLLVEDDRLLLGTDRGAWAWEQATWQELRAEYGDSRQVWSLYRYQRGQSWALAPGGQLFTVGEDSLRARKVPARNPTVFHVSAQGDSWLGSQDQGVFVLPRGGREWLPIGRNEGLGSNLVRAVTSDRWGNVWVGTSGGGLSCLRQAPFQAFDRNRGLPDRAVYTLTEVDSSGIFFALANQGIYRQTSGGPTPLLRDEELRGEKIKAIARDARGWWWAGTPGNGIKVKTDSTWLNVKTCGEYIIDLLPAGPDQWWVATAYEGLSRLSMREDATGIQWSCRTFGSEHALPIGRIESLNQDNQGRLLIAYREKGLACWEPNRLHWQVSRREGLPSTAVRAVRQDSFGAYWLATARGLARVVETGNDLRVETFQNQDGLSSNNLYCLAFTAADELWVGSERGMDRIALDAERNPRQITYYGPEEGFSGIETCTDAALADQDGNLWVGTMNGLMLHENKPLRTTKAAPPILSLADLQLSYRSAEEVLDRDLMNGWGQLTTQALQLNYDQNQLRFELRAQDLAQPQDLLYSWRLEGWEEAWTPPSEQRFVSYGKLPPGNYVFHARAVGEGGRNSDALRLAIEIVPAFWQTQWFRTGSIVLGVLLLGLLLWRIFHRRLQKQQRIAGGLRLQNRLLELEQKALRLQMNPHFLANALQGIQYELNEGAYERAGAYLAKFGTLMRSMLYHSRARTITLADEIETLRHYLELESFRTAHRFTYDLQSAGGLEIDLIEIPPMLLQPFIENAVHHGMRTKQGDGHITVHFAEEGLSILVVTIRDNGPGLAASAARRSSEHRSTALQVIRERLELLEMERNVEPYRIEEVVEQGIVRGVKVEVRVPIQQD